MSKEEFIFELKKLGINLTCDQLNNLEKYYCLLIEWNKKMNLTRIINKDEVYLKHFYDSLTIVKVINLKKVKTLLDFGTGAGFPGLVLKIVYPNLEVTLLDSLNKRITFLNEVIKQLNLTGIYTVHKRIEEYSDKSFDVITTRAVANLSKLLDYTCNLIDGSTKFIPLKAHIEEELQEINRNNKLNQYKLKITRKESFALPKENSQRTILVIEKVTCSKNNTEF